jgi:hypothetical protein
MTGNATWLAAWTTLGILAGYEALLAQAGFDRCGPQDVLV